MAKDDYYFPLYYRRLLSSTIGWKDDEFGAYVRLLIHQFDNGSIPDDLKELALIAPSIKKNWKRISKKFRKSDEGLRNHVMEEIYNKVQHKKLINSDNAKKRYCDGSATAVQTQCERSATLITNNKELITNNKRERGSAHKNHLGSQSYNAEETIKASLIEFERICMQTGVTKKTAESELHKYHLWLEASEKYPKGRKAVFAGFERWLMDLEKFSENGTNDKMKNLLRSQ